MDIEEAIKEMNSLSPSETAIETILNELEKKDKIIDLMANQVLYDDMKTEANRFVTSEEIIEYFTNKAEEDIKE